MVSNLYLKFSELQLLEGDDKPFGSLCGALLDYILDHVNSGKYNEHRLFKQQTGISPHSYLLSLQLKHAKTLLVESGLTVQQIAAECGFASSTHFIRAFKAKNAVTPAAFRKYYNPSGFRD